jgi:hypothetical protein
VTSINGDNNTNDPINDHIIDAGESQDDEANEPPNVPDPPRRSSRVVTKTIDKSEGVVKSSRLEDTIRQSKESAQRKAAERQ